MGESIKSKYTPVYPHKYKGNSKMIICRSSWERKFCQWCDMNNSIVSWASEEFSIPYVSPKDNRVHKYYPDYLIKVKEKNDMIKTYVVEVKPYKQTMTTQNRRVAKQNHILLSVLRMQSIRQSGKQQKNFVKIIVLNLKLSQRKNLESDE